MLSVSQRLESVSQPYGGYVPKKLFAEHKYNDDRMISEIDAAFAPIQGMVVDYLTRFMFTHDKMAAFDISIRGAKKVDFVFENDDEYKKALSFLQNINGLDDNSIYNACKIVGYDTVLRRGVKTFKSVDLIKPTNALIGNIRVMVERCLHFLDDVGPVISSEVTFGGGYTGLVSSGDGDYMTADKLIELKVSKHSFKAKWSLQLLMYYLLGFNSINSRFKRLKELCIFNPYENKSYIAQIDAISDEAKYKVSHEILGYKMKYDAMRYDNVNHITVMDYSTWKYVNGTDVAICTQFSKDNMLNGFDVNDYQDGIHRISVDDYWSFLKVSDEQYESRLRPIFKYTDHVLMIKNLGYIMFVSVSPDKKFSVLHGAMPKKTHYTPEYFYNNIERYANGVIERFSKYWNVLYAVSEEIKALKPDEDSLRRYYYSKYITDMNALGRNVLSFEDWYEERGKQIKLSGRVHGCIVDIDYHNHIYINPYDGTMTSYCAVSKYDKDVYKNALSLIAAQRPEMLEAFKTLAGNKNLLSVLSDNKSNELVSVNDVISPETVKVYDYNMYSISNKLKPLQSIVDRRLIQVWYDDILNDEKYMIEDATENIIDAQYTTDNLVMENEIAADYIGKMIHQNRGFNAKLIEFRGDEVVVELNNGIRVENVSFEEWIEGKMELPHEFELERTTLLEEKRENNRKKYLGNTKKMKCGLMAAIIEYNNCNDITVQFEDGYIRKNVKLDRFKRGTVFHPDIENDAIDVRVCGFNKKKICDTSCKYYYSCTRKIK